MLNFSHFRPLEFLECEKPTDHRGNQSARDDEGHGCVKVKMDANTIIIDFWGGKNLMPLIHYALVS